MMTQPSDDNRRQQDRGRRITAGKLRINCVPHGRLPGTGNDLPFFAWNLRVPFDWPEFGLISLKG
jgi:hypothetical protein